MFNFGWGVGFAFLHVLLLLLLISPLFNGSIISGFLGFGSFVFWALWDFPGWSGRYVVNSVPCRLFFARNELFNHEFGSVFIWMIRL